MVCTLGISRVYWFSRRTENYHFLMVFLGSNFCRQKWNIPETYGFWRNYCLGWFPKLSFDRRWFGYSTGGLFHTYYARYWRAPKLTWATLACRAGVMVADEWPGECSELTWQELWQPSLIFTTAEGWGEKEICTKGVSDGQKEGVGRGGAINISQPYRLFPPLPPPFILPPNQTWSLE